jgi:phospholipase A2
MAGIASVVLAGGMVYTLCRNDLLQPLSRTRTSIEITKIRAAEIRNGHGQTGIDSTHGLEVPLLGRQTTENGVEASEDSAWVVFTRKFDTARNSIMSIKFKSIPGSIRSFMTPDWASLLPDHLTKLQRELSMATGSLADEIWQEAHDPDVNPEIGMRANVRLSDELCDEEKEFLGKRRKVVAIALAKYLDIPQEDVHPDDVPIIAMCGSGGGLRALVAGTGSYQSAAESGLFDCITCKLVMVTFD